MNLHSLPLFTSGKLGKTTTTITTVLDAHEHQEANTPGAYPGFCNMKQLRVLLLPPGWDSNSRRATISSMSPVPIFTPGWIETT